MIKHYNEFTVKYKTLPAHLRKYHQFVKYTVTAAVFGNLLQIIRTSSVPCFHSGISFFIENIKSQK